jgi:hypothetical protein
LPARQITRLAFTPFGKQPVFITGFSGSGQAVSPMKMMVLLHSYKKQRQKAPAREIKIAERRMKGVLDES